MKMFLKFKIQIKQGEPFKKKKTVKLQFQVQSIFIKIQLHTGHPNEAL